MGTNLNGIMNAYKSMYEDASYHKAMAHAHGEHSAAHESEVTNGGHEDHDYAGTDHAEAENSHKAAATAYEKHGPTSQQYKSAAVTADKHSKIAHRSSSDAGEFKETSPSGAKFPKKT